MSNQVNAYNMDIAQLFVGGQPQINSFVWTNTSGGSLTLKPGTLFGQIEATALVLPHISTAVDGSEQPFGVLAGIDPITLANGATATIPLAQKGNVNQNMLILGAGDTLSTPVRTVSTGGATIGALILRNTGLIVVPSNNVTGYDNTVS